MGEGEVLDDRTNNDVVLDMACWLSEALLRPVELV
jgi:hypothetical protein